MTQLTGAPKRIVERARHVRALSLIPPVVTLIVGLIGIDSASFWRDEAATLDAEARPIPALFRMLTQVDAVHGAYYLLMWPVVHVFGGGEFAVRFPSVLAMAGAAYGVGVLGARLHSRTAGLLAGLVFAVLPQVSRYGDEARSYAFVVAVAVLATYFLVRALAEPGRRWWVGYGGSVAALGLLNLFALLVLFGHAVFVLYQDRPKVRAWLVASVFACVPSLPVIVFAIRQQDQLSWVGRPDANAAGDLATWLVGSVLSVGVASVLIGLFIGKRKCEHGLAWLAVPWLVLPPILLILGSELKPVYVQRYLAFCLPALALLVGAGLATVTMAPRVIGLLLIAVLGVPTQNAIRQVGGHGDDIREAATIVAQQAQPGDGVLFNCPFCHYPDMPREFEFAYPQAFAPLIDVTVADSPGASNTLRGTELDTSAIDARLAKVRRVWVIDVDGNAEPTALRGRGLHLASVRQAGNITVESFTR
ncbi:MAG TPA: glycosyltransferase family 39 protein [Pseudonocardiaceae bacterium]|nr:glycosyltransferase family 39 protein [Pseudonocardiaceae bacterium]